MNFRIEPTNRKILIFVLLIVAITWSAAIFNSVNFANDFSPVATIRECYIKTFDVEVSQ